MSARAPGYFSAESIAVGIALVVGIDRIMSEGRALTNAIGNATATRVIAKWHGERDDERFQAVLDDPSLVDEQTDRALRGDAPAPKPRETAAGARLAGHVTSRRRPVSTS